MNTRLNEASANKMMDVASGSDNELTEPQTNQQFWGAVFLCVVIIGIVVGMFSIVSWMMDDERLPLSRLVIEGDLKQIQPEQIRATLASMPELGTFMSQDINELQQVLAPLPWVKNVSIRKQWPDLIKVYIVEYKAQAIWNGSQLLNPEGKVFNGDPSLVEDDVIRLYGPDEFSAEVLGVWRTSSQVLKPLGLEIESVVLNERRAWQMILTNGIRLELGKDVHESRLQRFVRLYQALGEKASQVSYIDLRYDTGAAVGWITESN